MRLLCVCPTYRRAARLLENSIECFLSQQPSDGHSYHLIILDDGGTHQPQSGANWDLVTDDTRAPTLASKYPRMIEHAKRLGIEWDALVIWDDDDVYLPSHLAKHATALETGEYSYPSWVLSTYVSPYVLEPSGGRFWGSLAVRRDAYEAVGGVPQSERGDFDQAMLRALESRQRIDPLLRSEPLGIDCPTYVFRWMDTKATHVQRHIKSPCDITWYANYSPSIPVQPSLQPKFDQSTRQLLVSMDLWKPLMKSRKCLN